MSWQGSRTRVEFDFVPDALQRLDDLKVRTDAATRAEVVRSALRVYEWFVASVEEEDTIEVHDTENTVKHRIKAYRLLYRR